MLVMIFMSVVYFRPTVNSLDVDPLRAEGCKAAIDNLFYNGKLTEVAQSDGLQWCNGMYLRKE